MTKVFNINGGSETDANNLDELASKAIDKGLDNINEIAKAVS